MLSMHQNTIEILAKLDQVMTSDQAHVTIEQVNPVDGSVSTTDAPTIGNFMARLQNLEQSMNVLTGISGNPVAVHVANNAYKRLILADVNLEPNDITAVNAVSTFRSDKNWFFDSMMNPSLSVEFDLTGKVQQSVRKVQSRRFIVRFSKDADGVLTDAGQVRELEFNTRYKGNNNIDITDFVAWLTSPAEGLQNRSNPLVDDQVFDLLPHRLKYNGSFNVLGTELDTLNRKLWYKLDTLNYQDVGNPYAAPSTVQLAVGDEVAVTPNIADQSATTVYTVAEISTVTTDNRVRFERKSGQDPIPVRNNALKMYSPVVYDKRVRITIGYDECNVIFVKPLHADNNILSLNWSKGVGFFTNDLRLDTSTGTSLADYYVSTVYDYGAVLQDLVAKKIPNLQGVQPLPPNLVKDNFKVVQINKHLTDSTDADGIRALYQTMVTYRGEVDALQAAVSNKQKEISTKNYASDADRTADIAELAQLSEQAKSKNTLMASVLQKILQQKKNVNDIAPKFRARGFWAMPEAIQAASTQDQEVVQFEIQYRYSAKSGSQPQTDQFTVAAPLSTSEYVATNRGTSAAGADNTTDNATAGKPLTASFSTWNRYMSELRQRTYNDDGSYTWVAEDLSNTDSPNINQLDVPISQGEIVEIRVRSLSEVGWPDAPLTSEWSEIIPLEFPDEFNSLLNNDDFILSEAAQEDQRLRFVRELEILGIIKHVSTSFTVGDKYYAHSAVDIASGFLDANNNIINVYDYLRKMQAEIDALKESVSRAKGELRVRLFKGDFSQPVSNYSELNFKINLEDYAEVGKFGPSYNTQDPKNVRTYVNKTYVIDDYFLVVDNTAAENALGLFSTRSYDPATSGSTGTPFAFPVSTSSPTTDPAQPLWVDNNDSLLVNTTAAGNRGQTDNQWLWLQHSNTVGGRLYGSDSSSDAVTSTGKYTAITTDGINIGLPASSTGTQDQTKLSLLDANAWVSGTKGQMGLTVHPMVPALSNIVDTGTDKTRLVLPGDANQVKIPLKIYAKFDLFAYSSDLFGTTDANWLRIVDGNTGSSGSVSYAVITVNWPPAENNTKPYIPIHVGDYIMVDSISIPGMNNIPMRVIERRVNYTGGRGPNTGYNDIGLVLDYPTTLGPQGGRIIWVGKDLSNVQDYPNINNNGRDTTATGDNSGIIQSFVKPSESAAVSQMYTIKSQSAVPRVMKKSLRFFLEPSSLARPFEFTVNFEVTQFKNVAISRGI